MYRSFLSCAAFAAAALLNAQSVVHQVLVLNEGHYDYMTSTQLVPVTLGSYDPANGTYQTVATINDARFSTDVKVDDGFIYVAADTMLLKYDADTYALVDQVVVTGIRRFAIWNDQVLVARGEYGLTDDFFEVFDKNTLDLMYALGTQNGPAYASDDVEVIGDKAYVAVNNGFDYPNFTSLIGVVDLTNGTYSEIDLGPDGTNPENIMVANGDVYVLNNKDFNSSSISRIDHTNGALQFTANVAVGSGCGASALVDEKVCYVEYALGRISRFNTLTDAVQDTLPALLNPYGMIDDTIAHVMYTTTTDFLTTGELQVSDYAGNQLSSVAVGVAAGRLALDVRSSTGVGEAVVTALSVFPNPATDRVTISGITRNTGISILDATGRVVLEKPAVAGLATSFDASGLAPGIYGVRLQGAATVEATFIKQ